MASELTMDHVTRLFGQGVEAVKRVSSQMDANSWDVEVCGHWTATETARHLLAVTGWYHDWLDRAISGDQSRPFAGTDIDRHNEQALSTMQDVSGPDAIADFATSARTYLDRAAEHWDLPFAYPFGTVTVGLHCGIAATEWELHAWDLSQTIGHRHQPADPENLFVAAGLCVAQATGGMKGNVMRRLIPIASRRDPWGSILKKSGRVAES